MTGSYRLRDLERRLAEEAATAELGVHLEEHDGSVVVQGEVASQDSRRAVLRRVADLCPDLAVVDQLTTAEETLSSPPRTSEELR